MSVFRNDDEVGLSSDDIEPIKSNGLPKPLTTSPEASSTASDSPTPTNSVHEKNWYTTHWQALVSEEQRQLLGTEEDSSDRQSDCDGENGGGNGNNVVAVSTATGSATVEEDVWEVTEEQRDYYRTQFLSLQPDCNGLLPGSVARAFFEKSRLPVAELRKIWQLSDVSKDGALSLNEFNTAMHLVVLRRNHIPLPDVLPPCLIPSSPSNSNNATSLKTSPHRAKQWTKFVESPTNSISSPGPKPVNFDFQKASVEQDPKILHPVPLRVTPGPGDIDESPTLSADIRPIQRPQPKKHTAPGPGAIPPPPVQPVVEENIVCGKKEPPPPPPPRPCRHHTRSSSLDLTRLGRSNIMLNMPPTVPPRTSPGTVSPKKQSIVEKNAELDSGFANFAQFPDDNIKKQINQGAFQIYRKPGNSTISKQNLVTENTESGKWSPPEIPLDVSVVMREAHNAVLRQHCHQLQQSLAKLMEERTNLQAVLDQLTNGFKFEQQTNLTTTEQESTS